VAQPIKISKPSTEQERALSLKGSDWRLVWDPKAKNWKTVKVGDVKPSDITYDDWKNGQTTYTPITPGRGGALDVAQETAAKEAEQDPLYKYVRDYSLEVVTDEKTGNTYLAGIPQGTTTAVPFYLYLDSKGTINLSQDYNAIKKKALDDLKATGKLDALFQELYNKKKISKETFNSRNIQATDFNGALVNVINSYSKSVIGNRQFDPTATKAPDFLTFLQSGASGLGGGGGDENLPRREFQDISKIELNKFIDAIYLETIGRKPTEEQRKAKLKELNDIVKKGIVTTTSVVGGEIQTRRKGGFDERQQALKLQEELKTQNPLEYERRQAFEFMTELGKIMSGGM
jgi:hypothetical protein